MTPEQYWDGDCTLTKHYREANELRLERDNFNAWLQGMYIYEALCDVSPIFRDFAKRGTKAHPYAKEPYDLGAGRKKKEARKQLAEDRKHKEGFKRMEEYMIAHNAKLKASHNNRPKAPDNGALQE